MIIIEEHHEEIIYLYDFFEKKKELSPYYLVHVDEHADMFSPIISEKHLSFSSKSDVERLVYNELRISDFLLPLFYNNIINEVLWISNETKTMSFSFNIRKERLTILGEEKIKLIVNTNAEQKPYKFHQISVSQNIVNLKNKNIILTIDIDYFVCNDNKGESLEIEIAKDEYERVLSDKFHTLKLSYGSRFKTYVKDRKYYLIIQEYIDNTSIGTNEDKIVNKIHKLGKYLSKTNINPKLILVCKSSISGYVSIKESQFIIKNLNILNKYIKWE